MKASDKKTEQKLKKSKKSKAVKAFGVFSIMLVLILSVVSAVLVSAVEVDSRTNMNFTRNAVEDAINQGHRVGLDVIYIKINEDEVENGDEIRTDFKRDSSLNIRIKLLAHENVSNVEIYAMINGDDHNKMVDATQVFDVEDNTIYTKTLNLNLADIMEKGNYKLRIMITDRNDAVKVYNYNLKIDTPRHQLQIKDAVFSPASEVKQGRALLSVVRLRNWGQKDEKDVKVTVSIPELNLVSNEYIDEIKADDTVSSEELYLRIPKCAQPKDYKVIVKAEYDEGTKEVEKDFSIKVVKVEGVCLENNEKANNEKSVISVPSNALDVSETASATYPVVISNMGTKSKIYTISIDGVDGWAKASISPLNIVLVEPNQIKTVYIRVSADKNAQPGEHMFSVTVDDGKETKEIPLKANVTAEKKVSTSTNWRKVFEYIFIGAVVLLVIIVVVALFNKMKNNDDEENFEDNDEDSYY